MDDERIIIDFIRANTELILELGGKVYNETEENIKILLKTAYSNYLKNSYQRYSKTKSFFIRDGSVDLYSFYVPTGIKSGKDSILNPDFELCTNVSNNIVICGTGGSGKSVLIKHLFLDCIKKKKYIPILVELRELNSEEQGLNGLINSVLDRYGFNVNGSYVTKAKKAGHFCLFLDGYDEVSYKIRKALLKDIKKLVVDLNGAPIFVSSRPDDVLEGLEEFTRFKMLPLDVESASTLIDKLPYEEEIKNKFIKDLREGLFEQHQSFLSNPLLLSIMLLTYGENAEIPSKLSIFYNQAYEALFLRHDARKNGFQRERLTDLDIQDFGRVFSLFCLQTYEKRKFKFPRTECLSYIEKSKEFYQKRFKPEDYMSDLLSAACLLIDDGLEVAFSHRSFQEYFVALYISNATSEIQKNLISRYWKNMRSDNVIPILLEINPDLIEVELIIPKLEELFNGLGVKRKVGVTHGFKYLCLNYTKLMVGENNLSARLEGINAGYSDIVHMVNHHLGPYFRSKKNYLNKSFFKKYGDSVEQVEYEIGDMTYKTPIMAEVLNSGGAFSVKYLQNAYDGYKSLKKKHQKISVKLDDLLGIK